jgi:hypothetical protein
MNLKRANLFELGLGNEYGDVHNFTHMVATTTDDPKHRAALRNRVGQIGLFGYDRLGCVKSLGLIYIDPELVTDGQ